MGGGGVFFVPNSVQTKKKSRISGVSLSSPKPRRSFACRVIPRSTFSHDNFSAGLNNRV